MLAMAVSEPSRRSEIMKHSMELAQTTGTLVPKERVIDAKSTKSAGKFLSYYRFTDSTTCASPDLTYWGAYTYQTDACVPTEDRNSYMYTCDSLGNAYYSYYSDEYCTQFYYQNSWTWTTGCASGASTYWSCEDTISTSHDQGTTYWELLWSDESCDNLAVGFNTVNNDCYYGSWRHDDPVHTDYYGESIWHTCSNNHVTRTFFGTQGCNDDTASTSINIEGQCGSGSPFDDGYYSYYHAEGVSYGCSFAQAWSAQGNDGYTPKGGLLNILLITMAIAMGWIHA
jgi:hypothetical protein